MTSLMLRRPAYRDVPSPQHAASRSNQPTAFDNAAGVASKSPAVPGITERLIGTVAMASAIWPCGPQGQYRVRERQAAEATVAAVTASQCMALMPGSAAVPACSMRNRAPLSVSIAQSACRGPLDVTFVAARPVCGGA
jgi:hypothetical protein